MAKLDEVAKATIKASSKKKRINIISRIYTRYKNSIKTCWLFKYFYKIFSCENVKLLILNNFNSNKIAKIMKYIYH